MVRVINITGGMGVGKSYISNLFKETGVPVLDTDKTVKNLYSDSFIKSEMKILFGNQIYLSENVINKELLSKKVFSNKELNLKVATLIKGALLNKVFNFIYENIDKEMVLIESALSVETKLVHLVDEVILVDAELSDRLQKLEENRGFSRKESLTRMALQKGYYAKKEYLEKHDIDHVVFNNDYCSIRAKLFVEQF